jgi:hypothetical protein
MSLIGLDLKKMGISAGQVYKHFKEEQVPDEIRAENAFLYAQEFHKDQIAYQARLAWLAAWAYRRSVAAPVTGPYLMAYVDSLNRKLADTEAGELLEPEKRVAQLVEEYKKTDRYSQLERQILLIMMGGDYQRLGYHSWAIQCLKAALQSIRNDSLWSKADHALPQRREKTATALTAKQFLELRQSLAAHCQLRLTANTLERQFLQIAAKQIRRGLASNAYEKRAWPAMVYLVGEFERRLGNLPRAARWFQTANEMPLPTSEQGVEIWAQEQLKQIPNPKAVYPQQRDDAVLLLKLKQEFPSAATAPKR